MTTVYFLYHNRPVIDDEEDEKFIGIYSSKANAEAAIERFRKRPGFRDWPNCFKIFEDVLDQDGWTEGFITGEAALRPLEEDKK